MLVVVAMVVVVVVAAAKFVLLQLKLVYPWFLDT